MKKFIASLALVGLCATSYGEMNDLPVTFSLITTNSDSETYVVRGGIEAVLVDVAATKTNVILITDAVGATVFSATVAADAVYPIRVPVYGTTASALTFVGGGATNDTVNSWYGVYPSAGALTIRAAGAANTTGTNSVTVKVIYR